MICAKSVPILRAQWEKQRQIIPGAGGKPCTLPPERTQPQKLCTANFSSGTLKTLINRLLRLKNKIFWRAPCEKKPFFSRLKSDSQKYILKWSYWPEIFAQDLKNSTRVYASTFFFRQMGTSWGLFGDCLTWLIMKVHCKFLHAKHLTTCVLGVSLFVP